MQRTAAQLKYLVTKPLRPLHRSPFRPFTEADMDELADCGNKDLVFSFSSYRKLTYLSEGMPRYRISTPSSSIPSP
jgi:hypothetical protein